MKQDDVGMTNVNGADTDISHGADTDISHGDRTSAASDIASDIDHGDLLS